MYTPPPQASCSGKAFPCSRTCGSLSWMSECETMTKNIQKLSCWPQIVQPENGLSLFHSNRSCVTQRPISATICGGVPSATSGGLFSTRILMSEGQTAPASLCSDACCAKTGLAVSCGMVWQSAYGKVPAKSS